MIQMGSRDKNNKLKAREKEEEEGRRGDCTAGGSEGRQQKMCKPMWQVRKCGTMWNKAFDSLGRITHKVEEKWTNKNTMKLTGQLWPRWAETRKPKRKNYASLRHCATRWAKINKSFHRELWPSWAGWKRLGWADGKKEDRKRKQYILKAKLCTTQKWGKNTQNRELLSSWVVRKKFCKSEKLCWVISGNCGWCEVRENSKHVLAHAQNCLGWLREIHVSQKASISGKLTQTQPSGAALGTYEWAWLIKKINTIHVTQKVVIPLGGEKRWTSELSPGSSL